MRRVERPDLVLHAGFVLRRADTQMVVARGRRGQDGDERFAPALEQRAASAARENHLALHSHFALYKLGLREKSEEI